MYDNPVILNLQILIRESYISVIYQAIEEVDDRKADADTHLAKARRQNTGNGILGNTKDEKVAYLRPLFHIMQKSMDKR